MTHFALSCAPLDTPSRRWNGYIRGVGENVVMRLIGLVTTVLVLGAVYLFIVKPVLDTTNDAFNSVNGTINNAFENTGLDDVDFSDSGDIQNQIKQAQKEIQQSSSVTSAQQERGEKILRCVQRVQPDTTKMAECAQKF